MCYMYKLCKLLITTDLFANAAPRVVEDCVLITRYGGV